MKMSFVKRPRYGGPKDPVTGRRVLFLQPYFLEETRKRVSGSTYRRLAAKAADSAVYWALNIHAQHDNYQFERLCAALRPHWKAFFGRQLRFAEEAREAAGVTL